MASSPSERREVGEGGREEEVHEGAGGLEVEFDEAVGIGCCCSLMTFLPASKQCAMRRGMGKGGDEWEGRKGEEVLGFATIREDDEFRRIRGSVG